MSWNVFADVAEVEKVIVEAKNDIQSLKSTLKKLVPFIQAVTVLLPPADAIIANAIISELNTLVQEIPDSSEKTS